VSGAERATRLQENEAGAGKLLRANQEPFTARNKSWAMARCFVLVSRRARFGLATTRMLPTVTLTGREIDDVRAPWHIQKTEKANIGPARCQLADDACVERQSARQGFDC
jgi:hypothetical protein